MGINCGFFINGQFLNVWGFFLLRPYILECEIPKFIGDGYCDDENNKEACNFDQGDCCPGKHVEVKKDYCTVCACLGDSGAGIVNFVIKKWF